MDDSHIYRSEVGRLFDYTVEEGKFEMVSEWTKALDALNAAQHNGILFFEGLDRCTPKHIQASTCGESIATLECSNRGQLLTYV